MPRKSWYYQDGFGDGHNASFDTDWQPGEMRDAYEKDRLGEVMGEILEHWQQMEGTIYYEEGITDKNLDQWEEGFRAGFERGVYEQLGPRGRSPAKRESRRLKRG